MLTWKISYGAGVKSQNILDSTLARLSDTRKRAVFRYSAGPAEDRRLRCSPVSPNWIIGYQVTRPTPTYLKAELKVLAATRNRVWSLQYRYSTALGELGGVQSYTGGTTFCILHLDALASECRRTSNAGLSFATRLIKSSRIPKR